MLLYSHTRLKSFEQCPLQYKLKYIDSIPEPVENIEVFVGKRVHEVLEQLFRTLTPNAPPSLKDLRASYRTAWDQKWNQNVRIVRGDSPQLYFSYGTKCIDHFYNTHVPFNQSATLYLEHKLEFCLDDSGAYGIQGYADRISKRSDGVYEIHDFKTGRRALTQRDADSDRQLGLYEIGFRVSEPAAKKVDLVWHCLGAGVTVRSHRTPSRRTRIRQDTLQLIKHIESQTQFPANKTRLCDWCSYRTVCPAWGFRSAVGGSFKTSPPIVEEPKTYNKISSKRAIEYGTSGRVSRILKKLFIWLIRTDR
jgi:putative RecB family exonuclease